ncbi:MAG: glycoside hydrolase family 1 protein [Anaerolineae bacterium]|nr:glycoside hydrolase family 1 protein [Anaerolineae bacterium]
MVDFTLTFPPGFLWGAATAAHQVEGGSPPNNWTAWEQTLGHIYREHVAGQACDWWGGRYIEDFDRAVAMHHNAHRFSVEWSRIEPERGQFDLPAIAHYADVLRALRERGMEPVITLHHFTNPLWVEEMGGWLNEETVRRFARFVQVVMEELDQPVTMWCTINEPLVYATNGYLVGRFPPGDKNLRNTFLVIENLLRGHAAAYHTIKDIQPDAQVGLAKAQINFTPMRPSWLHQPARNLLRQTINRAFIDAIITGELRLPMHKVELPEARDTLDWIGLNYYYRLQAGFNPLKPQQVFIDRRRPREGILGPESVGEIWPEGIFDEIKWLCQRTDKPLYVTENGVPDGDLPDDTLRQVHLIRSLRRVWDSVNYNFPVKGYFYWTLVDNFEWAEGYDPAFRFGLYGCDLETQVRTKKRSADLYGAICAANALTSDMVHEFAPDAFDGLFPGVDVQTDVTLPPRP